MGKLIYAITTNDAPLDLNIAGVALETIHHDGMVAVVSETDAARLRPSRANIKQHQSVLEHLMAQRPAVLPMRFGTVSEDENTLISRILNAQKDTLRDSLKRLAGKVEFNLKVTYPQDALFAAARGRISDVPAGNDFNSKLMLGQAVERAIQDVHAETREHILAVLAGTYLEMRPSDGQGDETTTLNSAFLLQADGQRLFESAVERADAAFDGLLTFKMVGPLPVYSFVGLVIHLE